MVTIAIAEDDISCTQQLIDYLARYEKEKGEIIQITAFTDGYELVEQYKHDFDIILLDVQMPFVDGMTAAEEIRKTDPEVVIIFITCMAQYAIRGYAVDALDYVLKPISYFSFSQRLDKAIVRIKKRAACCMTIPIKGGVKKLDISQIYYIESQGHKLIFYTDLGEFTSSGTMTEIENKLQGSHFCRGNKGYLINLKHVDSVQDGCAVVNEKKLLLSRSRRNAFMGALADYVGEGMK